MMTAEDIVIDQIRVRAKPREAQMIVNNLQSSSWSVQPRYDWVFVRNISVKSAKEEVRQTVSHAVDYALSQAVDGRLSGAEHAGVVYFESFHQLLAFLLRDLLYGDALKKWYWQRWENLLKEPKAQAINHLLWENAEYLPAVCEVLTDINLIAEIWQNLSEQSAVYIVSELFRDTQYLPISKVWDSGSEPSRKISLQAEQSFKRHSASMYHWVQTLSTFDSDDARYQLAVVISSLQFCPLLLDKDVLAVQHGFDRFIQSFRKKGEEDNHSRNITQGVISETGRDSRETSMTSRRNEHFGDSPEDKSHAGKNIQGRFKSEENQKLSLEKVPEDNQLKNKMPGKQVSEISEYQKTAAKDRASESVPRKQNNTDDAKDMARALNTSSVGDEVYQGTESPIHGYTFNTSSGGLFYLINALNSKEIQELLNEDLNTIHPNGWLWLFDMTRRLGAELDFNLLQFVADQSGYENIKALIDIAPLRELDEVGKILASHYLKAGCWDQSLINVPANIVSSASHIDVFFPLESVRIAVRLAGLDVNPGWVSWIGRVVTFHYRYSFKKGQV